MKKITAFLCALVFAANTFAADVWYKTTDKVLPTSTGVFTVEIASMGTPKLVAVTITRAITDGTAATNATWSKGWSDGTRQWVTSISSQDGVTTNVIRDGHDDTQTVLINSLTGGTNMAADGTGDGSGSNPGPFTDGWRFNMTLCSSCVAYIAKVEFWGGADLEAVVSTDLATTGAKTFPSALSGAPDLMFVHTHGDNFDTQGGFLASGWGVTDCTTEIALGVAQVDGVNPSESAQVLDTSKSAGQKSGTTWAWSTSVGTCVSTGYTLTTTGGTGGDELGYAAIYLGGGNSWVGSVDLPTVTSSDWIETGPGFQPAGFGLWTTYLTAEDVHDTTVEPIAFSYSTFDGTREMVAGISDEDAVNPADTQNLVHDRFFHMADAAGTLVFDSDVCDVTFVSTGI